MLTRSIDVVQCNSAEIMYILFLLLGRISTSRFVALLVSPLDLQPLCVTGPWMPGCWQCNGKPEAEFMVRVNCKSS